MTEPSAINISKMKIGWFASSFAGRSASGTSYLAKKAIIALLTSYGNYFEIILFTKNDAETKRLINDGELSGATVIQLPTVKYRILSGSRQYYKFCQTKKKVVDIVHFSTARVYPFFWLFPARKFISTFHAAGDVTVNPGKFILSRHIYNFIVKRQWRKLDAILAVSEFGKKEIVNNYGVYESAIRLVPPGADSLLHEKPKEIKQFSNKKNFISVLGRWQNYKNVGFAIEHLDKLNQESPTTGEIALVGKSNVIGRETVEKVLSEIRNTELSLFEYLELGELKWLFINSRIVIIPSLNEGFGLPSFEAFAVGAIILVHKGTPASTILGDQPGVYSCDMTNPHSFKSKVTEILSEDIEINVQQRIELLEKLQLTWDSYARKIANLYFEQLLY